MTHHTLSLLLLHGNGGGGFRFQRCLPYFPAEVTVSAPTLPGFAGEPRDPALQSVADYARVLMPHLVALPRPRVLLGTGIGGTFALQALQTHGDDIDAVILHAPVGTRLDERTFPKLMKLPGMTQLGQFAFSTPLMRPLWRRLLFTQPIPDDYANQFFEEYARCQVFGQMFEIINSAWFAGLRPVTVPGALLWGEKERVLTVDQLEDYKTLLPNHMVRTVPDWDHFPMIEQPEDFAGVVTELARQLTHGTTR